jgi:hypothetical protein
MLKNYPNNFWGLLGCSLILIKKPLVLGSFKSLKIKKLLMLVFFENFRILEPLVHVFFIILKEPLDLGS